MRPHQSIGLVGGAVIFGVLLIMPAPPTMSPEGWRTAAVATLMAIWWVTEAIPIPATALLPLVLFPVLGILSMSDASAPYANDLIFLLMGGFFLAVALERWGLHRRVALFIVSRVGTSPERIVLGFMLASAALSMWISNTATTVMMLPVAVAVGEMFRPPGARTFPFGIALMLGICYGATFGGIATLVGTPPNVIAAAAAEEILGIQIGFLQWMAIGLPITVVLLPLGWLLLVKVLHPQGKIIGNAQDVLRTELARLGPWSRGEKVVGLIFALTAAAWVMRAPKDLGVFTVPGIQTLAPAVRDSTIAIGGVLLLFLAPVDWRRGVFALEWRTASKIPWGLILLFGGGLSLARAMEQSGLAAWVGNGVAGLSAFPGVVVFAIVATLFVFLTEITSNTATATMAMPIMAAAALGLGIAPVALMITAALASSMAFMLPVATPPNAIVFGSNYLTIAHMARAGFWLNLLAIGMITAVAGLLIPLVFS